MIPLTHYHTIPHFDALKVHSCGKHCEERRNCFVQTFFPFSQCFLPYMALIFRFQCTLKCRLQFVSIWTSLKFCRLVMGLLFTTQSLLLTILYKRPFKNIVGKRENAGNQHFLLFPQRLLPFPKQISIFQSH